MFVRKTHAMPFTACSNLKNYTGWIRYCVINLGNWRLPEVGLEDGHTGFLIWQWDIDKLVQTARPEDGRVDNIWSVSGTNDKHVLLAGHAIHLSQDLVNDTVGCSTAITHTSTTGFSNGVQLIKEEHAGGSLTSLGKKYFVNDLF